MEEHTTHHNTHHDTSAESERPAAPALAGGDKFLPISIVVAAVLISGSVLYAATRGGQGSNTEQNPPPAAVGNQADPKTVESVLTIRERDVVLGDPKASVSVIEYGDYQCPFCGRFYTGPEVQIRESYVKAGKVKMLYRNMAFLGPESIEAAEAAECAKDQGKFWLYHDALFDAEIKDGQEHNGNLNRELFVKLAGDVGMNVNDFTSCYDGNKYADVVTQETADAKTAGVNATPTTFVNSQVVQGAQPFESFKTIIDGLLK